MLRLLPPLPPRKLRHTPCQDTATLPDASIPFNRQKLSLCQLPTARMAADYSAGAADGAGAEKGLMEPPHRGPGRLRTDAELEKGP